jgi:hypothetical protein
VTNSSIVIDQLCIITIITNTLPTSFIENKGREEYSSEDYRRDINATNANASGKTHCNYLVQRFKVLIPEGKNHPTGMTFIPPTLHSVFTCSLNLHPQHLLSPRFDAIAT